MGEFIVGSVVDVLSHVGIQDGKGGGKGRISGTPWDFAVWNAAEFVVLHPEVRFQDFGGCRETKQGCISPGEMAAAFLPFIFRQEGRTIRQESDPGSGDACRGYSVLYKRTPWPRRTPLNPIIRARRVYDGYTVENVAFESVPGYFVTGNLFRPLNAKPPYAAVLATHGHAGKINKPEDYDH